MSILKNAIIVILLMSFSNLLFAQNENPYLIILPLKPHPGDTIILTYNAAFTNLTLMSAISALVSKYDIKGKESRGEIKFIRKDSVWTSKIYSNKTDVSILVKIISGKSADNQSKLGYPIILFGENAPVPHSYATLANVKRAFGPQSKDEEKQSLIYYEKEFELYPSNKKAYFLPYSILLFNSGQISHEILQKQLNDFCKQKGLSSQEYLSISKLYGKLGDEKAEKKYSDIAVKKDTTGQLLKNIKFETFQQANDLKQLDILEDFENNYEDQLILNRMYNIITLKYISKNSFEQLDDFIAKHPKSNNSYINYFIAYNIESKDDEIAMRFCKTALKQAIEGKNQGELALTSDLMGHLLAKQNKYDEALPYFKEGEKSVFVRLSRKPNAYNHYITALIKTNRPEAVPLVDSLLRIGRATEEMKNFLKNASEQKFGKPDFKHYSDSIETANNKSMKRVVEKKIINKPAPEFTLKDLTGRNVSLSDYKGKTVVLDFWATWCGPCIASFPAMQKVIDSYKEDKSVVFVMIDTRERVENKTKKVSEFMNKNGYQFNNLIDEDDNVSKAFQIKAFPTKLVIDKNGNIRFASSGYDNNEAGLINELSLMIEQIK